MNENLNDFQREPFLGGGAQIRQAGTFLPEQEGSVLYGSDGDLEEMRRQAQEHYRELASIAALEHHPGYATILDYIEFMRQEQFEAAQELVVQGKSTEGKLIALHHGAIVLQKLRDKILGKIGEYREWQEVERRHAEEKEE